MTDLSPVLFVTFWLQEKGLVTPPCYLAIMERWESDLGKLHVEHGPTSKSDHLTTTDMKRKFNQVNSAKKICKTLRTSEKILAAPLFSNPFGGPRFNLKEKRENVLSWLKLQFSTFYYKTNLKPLE